MKIKINSFSKIKLDTGNIGYIDILYYNTTNTATTTTTTNNNNNNNNNKGCKIPGYRSPWRLKFVRRRQIIMDSCDENLLHSTLMAPRVLRWLLDFWKICTPLIIIIHS
jgi:hypothetical protein